MKEFDFYGETITVSDGQENYARLRQEMEGIAAQLKSEFIQQYQRDYHSIDQVVANVFNVGEAYVLQAASWCIELMGKNHIYNYDTERFIKRYGLVPMEVWINACDKIANSYTSVIVNAQMSASVKQWQQNYRSKWLGSAFSSMPAVGKMPMDWSTGAEYPSVGDSIAPIICPNLVALFNHPDTLNTLADGLYRSVMGMHQGLVRALMEQSDHLIQGLDDEKLRDVQVIFQNIVNGVVTSEDVIAQAASIARIYPFKKELYVYMFDHYGDPSNVLTEMTRFFGLGDFMDTYKLDFVEKHIRGMDLTELEALNNGRETIKTICENGSVDGSAYISAFDTLIQKAREAARFVDGIVYEDDDLAGKARRELKELFEKTHGISGNKEDEIRQILDQVNAYSCKSRQKYADYLEEALKRADLRYRNVKNIMFDTREQAGQARKECETFEGLLKAPCKSKADIQGLKEKAEGMETCVRDIYTQLAACMNRVWNRQDILYSEKALYRPEKRTEYTSMWYEATELFQSGQILHLENEAYLKWYDMMNKDFLTVKGVVYNTALEANRAYYEALGHAIAYKKHMDEKNNTSKGFFASLKNSVSGIWSEKYQEDFEWLTLGGSRYLPQDTEEEGAQLENQYGSMNSFLENSLNSIRQIMDRAALPYTQQDEILSPESLMIKDQHISMEEVRDVMNKALKVHPLNPGTAGESAPRPGDNVCKNCGQEMPDEAVFCPFCGTKQ